MQDKKKKNIKVRDLKPKKDAKGGVASPNVVGANISTNRPGANRPGQDR